MAVPEAEIPNLRRGLMERAGRSLVLVPSDHAATVVKEQIAKDIKYPVFSASDIEHSKKPFVSTNPAVAVVAGRYDGIDFPNEECRLLFLDALPKATNLQERFIMSRVGANILYNERIVSRILQAVGAGCPMIDAPLLPILTASKPRAIDLARRFRHTPSANF